MLNFLPQKNKNQIIFEYLLRVTAFLLLFIFVSSLILISLFIPSFYFVNYKNDTINIQLESIKQKTINKSDDPVKFIKNVNRLSIALSDNSTSSIRYSELVNKITLLRNKDIKIKSIEISKDISGGVKMYINGIAATRDGLTMFDKAIKVDGSFKEVIFPVSNFYQPVNSEFSATLTL
jgi:hypothetical protein